MSETNIRANPIPNSQSVDAKIRNIKMLLGAGKDVHYISQMTGCSPEFINRVSAGEDETTQEMALGVKEPVLTSEQKATIRNDSNKYATSPQTLSKRFRVSVRTINNVIFNSLA